MTERPPAWVRFRHRRPWIQALIWLFLWPVPSALYAASRPAADRRRWWTVTVAVTVVWFGIGAASSASEAGRPQLAQETRSPAVEEVRSPAVEVDSPPGSRPSGAPEATSPTSQAPAASTTTRPGVRRTTSTTRPGSTSPPPASSPSGHGFTALAGLRVAPETPRTGYDRDLFQHWIDADGDRCDTREEVLIAESLTVAQVDPNGCRVIAGDWLSVYDGLATEQPGDVDVDHVVALAEAWDSGASRWGTGRRREFANDLGYSGSLIAVSASSNRSKGDDDPAEWMPPRREAWCSFATDWVTVKLRWDLSADEAEVAALRAALATCDDPAPPVGPLAPDAGPTTITPRPQPPPPASGDAVTVTSLDCVGERVTLGNGSATSIDLGGWTIRDDGAKHTFTFPAGYALAPGASVGVRSGGPAGPGELAWTGAKVWNNDGDVASLADPSDRVISTRGC